MGRQDLSVNQLLERKEIFADLMNGTLFQGQQILRKEELELLSGQSGILYEEEGKKKSLGRSGDIRMQGNRGTYAVIFSNETQSKVHYAMPVRNMLYDALEYTKQIQQLEKTHKERGDKLTGDEFLSGITKEDRLHPVVTTVFYLGKNWDGCKSLYELLGLEEQTEYMELLREYLPDYKINLIDARNIKEPEKFKTCLQHIFYMLKYNQDKKQLYQYLVSEKF